MIPEYGPERDDELAQETHADDRLSTTDEPIEVAHPRDGGAESMEDVDPERGFHTSPEAWSR